MGRCIPVMLNVVEEEERTTITKTPQHTFILCGAVFVKEKLMGHNATLYDIFRTTKLTFKALCTDLRQEQCRYHRNTGGGVNMSSLYIEM